MPRIAIFVFRDVLLRKPYTGHFSTNIGGIAAVKIKHCGQVGITGVADIRFHKSFAKFRIAVEIDVHSQESDIFGDIAAAEMFVKFNAVENRYFIVNADVIQMQITVTVPDPVIRYPFFKKAFVVDQKLFRVAFDEEILMFGKGDMNIICRFRKIFIVVAADIFDAAHFIDVTPRLGLPVK